MQQKMLALHRSLDEIEREYWSPPPSPVEQEAVWVRLKKGEAINSIPMPAQSLNGEWEAAFGGEEENRLSPAAIWQDAINAKIPCSVHTALFEAGVIPDPMIGLNDNIAREYCYKTWWFKKRFTLDPGLISPVLCFQGVCYRAKFWLNGVFLGSHDGMFGGPEFEIEHLLQKDNVLIVKIENAPADPQPLSDFMDNDEGWKQGVVVNCVYGWHYACLPSRGIWAPVAIESRPKPYLQKPFISTYDADQGILDLCLSVNGAFTIAQIAGTIVPENFEGEAYGFAYQWAGAEEGKLHLRMQLENPRLWWPLDHGEQALYRLQLVFWPENGYSQYRKTTFGIRTIEMRPLLGEPAEAEHNWMFTVNNKPIFVKGCNWCTTDALLRFPKERYDRFLDLAQRQHIQLLRAWGGGMPESDYFYDCCDRLGIMVMQEWPTCWDSQKLQPAGVLLETICYAVPRLRNHPSLIMWCGGNESREADGDTMDQMARLSYELDGTRTFRRTSPWGGGIHNYDTYWNMMDMDVSLSLRSPFLGEFGMASAPNLSSVRKYLEPEDRLLWPPSDHGSFTHHTPKFNQPLPHTDMEHMSLHTKLFSEGKTMEEWIWASQMSQATCIRHTLESYRSRWTMAGAVCYYKLTDVYPGCSWSTIDYYGVPKLSYYVLGDSYAPLHGCLLFHSISCYEGLTAPVVLLDDALCAKGKAWRIRVAAYNGGLRLIKQESYGGFGSLQTVTGAGTFRLGQKELGVAPLILTVETLVGGESVDRTFYWQNFRREPGCLLRLPVTELQAKVSGGRISITNQGAVPAIGVTVVCPRHETEFVCGDGVFWIAPGETYSVDVSHEEGLQIRGWNLKERVDIQ